MECHYNALKRQSENLLIVGLTWFLMICLWHHYWVLGKRYIIYQKIENKKKYLLPNDTQVRNFNFLYFYATFSGDQCVYTGKSYVIIASRVGSKLCNVNMTFSLRVWERCMYNDWTKINKQITSNTSRAIFVLINLNSYEHTCLKKIYFLSAMKHFASFLR